jgi:hypothetical protein
MPDNWMRFGGYEFTIEAASFRYVTQSRSGPGWDFSFRGPCVSEDPDRLFGQGARLYTEAAPMPLRKMDDYTGIELLLPLPYDEDSGEPLFGLKIMEEHDLSDLRLKFTRRTGPLYLIEIEATLAKTVLRHPVPLQLCAWAQELPDHAYPA